MPDVIRLAEDFLISDIFFRRNGFHKFVVPKKKFNFPCLVGSEFIAVRLEIFKKLDGFRLCGKVVHVSGKDSESFASTLFGIFRSNGCAVKIDGGGCVSECIELFLKLRKFFEFCGHFFCHFCVLLFNWNKLSISHYVPVFQYQPIILPLYSSFNISAISSGVSRQPFASHIFIIALSPWRKNSI